VAFGAAVAARLMEVCDFSNELLHPAQKGGFRGYRPAVESDTGEILEGERES
jgi:hypothetical protein